MESFTTKINDFQLLTVVPKISILDVYEIPSYASGLIFIKHMIKQRYS